MRLSNVVRSGPNQYICDSGALAYLPEKVNAFQHPVIITGEKSFAAFTEFYPYELKFPVLRYDGTASEEDMAELAKLAENADVIIGIGGGRVLDTAKGTAELLNCETIMIPTVLGTCAAYTPLSAVYHPDHSFKKVAYYHRSAYLVLLDLNLLVTSPKKYFLGGIGDTLAKWYEAESITRHLTGTLPAMVQLGLNAAKVTQEILLQDTPEAIASIEAQKITPAFQRVVEAVIGVAGTVGGFAGEFGRMSGAHAVHNALSFFPETHQIEHGVKVAYGILVQLMATGDRAEAKKLIPFYKDNGFLYNFTSLGIQTSKLDAFQIIADYAAKDNETFKLAAPNITAQDICLALEALEQLTAD